MSKIKFYEVLDAKSKWMGSYSPELDKKINVGMDAFTMAKINAKYHGGQVFQVNSEEERILVWPIQ